MNDIVVYKEFIDQSCCESVVDLVKSDPGYEVAAFYYKGIREFQVKDESMNSIIRSRALDFLKLYLRGTLSDLDGYSYIGANVMIYEDGSALPLHLDNPCFTPDGGKTMFTRTIGMVVFLNHDFSGGELIFPEQERVITPECGDIVVFPVSHLYPHMVNAISGGKRYALRINFVKNEKCA